MKRKVNKNRMFYFVVSVLTVIIIVVSGVKVFFDFFVNDDRSVVSKTTLDQMEVYGYTLDDLDTELYKVYFDELKGILDKDDVDYKLYAEGLIFIHLIIRLQVVI